MAWNLILEQQVFVDCTPFLLRLNCMPDGFCHGYADENALPSIALFQILILNNCCNYIIKDNFLKWAKL